MIRRQKFDKATQIDKVTKEVGIKQTGKIPKRVKPALGKGIIVFTNFRPGTPARRQVTLKNCGYSVQGGGMIYIERRRAGVPDQNFVKTIKPFPDAALTSSLFGMPIFAIIRKLGKYSKG